MKKTVTLLLTLLALNTAIGQIGGGLLNKAKDKANKAIDNPGGNKDKSTSEPAKTTSQPASSGSSTPASSGTTKATPTRGKSSATNPWGTGSPASYDIGILKSKMDELKTKHNSAWYSGKIDDIFADARKHIAAIKIKDPEWDVTPEEKLVEEYWKTYQGLAGNLKKDDMMADILKDINYAVKDGKAIAVINHSYADYAAYRDEYAKKSPENQTKIDGAEKYFNELYPAYLDDVLPDFATEMPNFNDDKTKMNPFQAKYTLTNGIEKLEKIVKAVKTGTKQETEAKRLLAAYTAEKAKFENFETSGDFDKFKATKAAEIVAKERFPKIVSNNATWEAAAKKRMTEYHSGTLTFLRSGVTTSDWLETTFPSGTPNYRSQYVYVGFKKDDGKCFYGRVTVRQKYSFGKWVTDNNIILYTGETWELLCENMNK